MFTGVYEVDVNTGTFTTAANTSFFSATTGLQSLTRVLPSTGNYRLVFGVANVGDNQAESGLAIDSVVEGDVAHRGIISGIGSGVKGNCPRTAVEYGWAIKGNIASKGGNLRPRESNLHTLQRDGVTQSGDIAYGNAVSGCGCESRRVEEEGVCLSVDCPISYNLPKVIDSSCL